MLRNLFRAAVIAAVAFICSPAFSQSQSYGFKGVVIFGGAGVPVKSVVSGSLELNLNAASPLLSGTFVGNSPNIAEIEGPAIPVPASLLNWSLYVEYSTTGNPPYTAVLLSSAQAVATANARPVLVGTPDIIPAAYTAMTTWPKDSAALQIQWNVPLAINGSSPQCGELLLDLLFAPYDSASTYFLNGLINANGVNPAGSQLLLAAYGCASPLYDNLSLPGGFLGIQLTSLSAAPAVMPQVVNINAATSGYDPATGTVTAAPVALTLSAGCYTVADAFGSAAGAQYDAFNYHIGTANDWAWQYRIVDLATLSTILYVSAPYNLSPAKHIATESAASAAGQAAPIANFCLNSETTVAFMIDDDYLPDNTGGISLLLN